MVKRISIPSDFHEARKVQDAIVDEAEGLGYAHEAIFAIKLALEESLNNAIRHGNMMDPQKSVHVEYETDASRVRVVVRDEGTGFDPISLPDPTADENLEKPSGRGIMLMRAFMDEVSYSPHGNCVEMVKRRQ